MSKSHIAYSMHHFKCGFTLQGKMINKRPFGGEDSYEVACKHPRQLEHSNEDIFPFNGAPQKFQISDGEGDGDGSFSKCPDEGRFASDLGTSVSNETYKELETGASGSFARFLRSNSSIIEANVRPEAASHLSLFPEFFAPVNQWRALLHSDEICSSPVDYPPRKRVSIGAQHQAHVPVWGFEGSHASVHLEKLDPQHELSCPSSQDLVLDVNEEKLMGTLVISMPDLEASAANYFCEDVGARSNCKCGDAGSVRCVRQHVMETREKLKEDLGEHLFEELGFYEMGEEVADKWTKEEEHAFLDVVLSNPVSLGKNFWHHLSVAFPFRTHKDLVSYYFNVFMLRKRTEQNRFDPLNIDSDDDEWQKSELGTVEDDEDSGVESPVNLDAPAYKQEEHLEGCYEHIEDAYDVDGCGDGNDVVDCVGMRDKDGGDIDDGSGAHVGSSPGDSGGTETQILDKIASNNREDYDIQDDSCTSYEYQQDS